MSDFIRIKNYENEYYQNGNIKNYISRIYHTELDKDILVKHKDYVEYYKKYDEAIVSLNNEYLAILKNDEVNIFYENMKNLVRDSDKVTFDIRKNYKFYTQPKFETPKFSYDETFDKYIDEKSPDYLQDYKPELNLTSYIFFPLYLFYLYKTTRKFKIDLQLYESNQNACRIRKEELIELENVKNAYHKETERLKLEVDEFNQNIDRIINGYENLDNDTIVEYIELNIVHRIKQYWKFEFDIDCNFEYIVDDHSLTVDLILPNEENFPSDYAYKYVKSRNEIDFKNIPKKKFNDDVSDAYYSIYIAFLNDLFSIDYKDNFEQIILNGYYEGDDKRTGQEISVCIMSAKVSKKEFENLNLQNVVPMECFKFLKGKGKPNPEGIIKIEPIRYLNKGDYKLIESESVIDRLSVDTNLAAMTWQDFEVLIRDVFELEFREKDIEIQNTQPTNDGGIDVVAFNKDPFTGGVILLQAKRYTKTVSPEPVRALKGSMQEKNAIRGILVTTSSFGKSSYDFAQSANITLMNGLDLINLLSKYGYDYHIDLEQARAYNN